MLNFRVSQNSKYPRCVDGRIAEAFIEWQDGRWQVVKRDKLAKTEYGPQFLGASLLFVRALEKLAQVDRSTAFDLVEKASEAVGLGLEVHIDNRHGHADISHLSDDELLDLVENYNLGCGFAKYAWGDDAEDVIKEAKRRKWRIQVLVDDHNEKGAVINYKENETSDTAVAGKKNNAFFETDVIEARKIFLELEKLLQKKGFAKQAEDWMLSEYVKVVEKLNGVQSADEVELVK